MTMTMTMTADDDAVFFRRGSLREVERVSVYFGVVVRVVTAVVVVVVTVVLVVGERRAGRASLHLKEQQARARAREAGVVVQRHGHHSRTARPDSRFIVDKREVHKVIDEAGRRKGDGKTDQSRGVS